MPAGPAFAGDTTRGLAGVTLDASGSTLSGVEVRIAPLGHRPGTLPLLRALSDERGRFALSALAPGAYRVVAVKGGYAVVVGQIDTVVQDTIRLVLRPTAGVAAGTVPADNSWTLRLPRRDVLEDVELASAPRETGLELAPAAFGSESLDVTFEALGVVLDGDRGNGGGAATLGARYASDGGRIAGFLAYRGERAGTYHDGGTGLRLRWAPDPGTPGRTFELQVDALRRDSATAVEDGLTESVEFGGTRWAVRDARESAGWSRELASEVVLADVAANGNVDERSVVHLAGRAMLGHAWDARHLMSAGVEVAATRGAFEPDSAEVVLLPDEVSAGTPRLVEALGDRVAIFVGDLWQTLPALAIATRARAEWSGYDGSLRAVPSVEARYTAIRGFVLRAEGGLVLGGDQAGSPVGRIAVSGGSRLVTVTAAADRVHGPGLPDESPAIEMARLVYGPDTRVDRVLLDVSARPGGGLPDVRLSAQRVEVDGDAVSRLPHDIALVPLASAARAGANRIELGFGLARTGSSLLVAWEQLNQDAGAPLLPDAAEGWERTAVSLRQRVLDRDGLAAFLVLGAESTRLEPGSGDAATLRATLLERRRLSGGVSVTF